MSSYEVTTESSLPCSLPLPNRPSEIQIDAKLATATNAAGDFRDVAETGQQRALFRDCHKLKHLAH